MVTVDQVNGKTVKTVKWRICPLACAISLMAACCAVEADVIDIPNAAFDKAGTAADPVPGWKVSGNFKAIADAGHNGSGGLVWESEKPTGSRHYAEYVFALEPGRAYRLSFLIMSESLAGSVANCCVQWHGIDAATGKKHWLDGTYIALEKGSHGWTFKDGVTPLIPTNAVSANILFYIEKGATGRVVFDNVALTTRDRNLVDFVTTSSYRDQADSGKVRFYASLNPPEGKASKVESVFSYTDAKGARRRVRPTASGKDFAMLELQADGLAMGRQDVVCECRDGGKTLCSRTNAFTRVKKLPVRKTAIDRFGRCVVDGKPFFPIGFFGSKFTEQAGKDMREAGCNVFMPYARTTRADLDVAQKYGVRLFADVRGRDPADPAFQSYVKEIVDHPALLSWYTNDERPVTDLPRLQALYDYLRDRDPEHFVWTVLDRLFDLREFTCSYDALGVDPYPIGRYRHMRPRHVAELYAGAKECVFNARPFFNVPQMFSWNGAKPDDDLNRFPTYEEIRSMTWQHIALGARGIVGYSYHDIGRCAKVRPDEAARRWQILVKVMREVAEAAPVLLSIEPAPTVKGVPETCLARTWRKDGATWLCVCNLDEKAGVTVALSVGGRAIREELPPLGVVFRRLK